MSKQKQIIYVFFGMIASGKSTLGQEWARRRGISYHNSDVVRKKMAGLSPTTRAAEGFGGGIYSADFSRKTYDALLAAAAESLRLGTSIVLDASYGKREERDRVRQLAAANGARALFILCACSEEETRRRLAQRERDPSAVSDGRWEIFLRQQTGFEPPVELAAEELIHLETSEAPDQLVKRLEELVNFG